MREMFCQDPCGSNLSQPLVSAPCFLCPGSEVVVIPPDASGPVQVTGGTSPSPISIRPDGTFVVGSGIRAGGSTVISDGAIEMYLAPFIANVTGSEDFTPPYEFTLTEDQELAVAYGAALISGQNVRITDYYDVALSVSEGAETVTLTLVDDMNTPSTYKWTSPAMGEVVDSAGNGMFVQNVTRLGYITLPEDTDVSTWTFTATRKGTGEVVTGSITVTIIGAE